MKKLLAILAVLVLFATMSVTALPTTIEERQTTPTPAQTGSFNGEIGYPASGEWTKVGEISGTYEQKNKFYKFEGNWEITEGDYAGTTGIMKGFFGKNILLGRITINNEKQQKLPIIGFIGFNESSQQFVGRFMSVVGPALYFKGTYQE